jgi:protein TonB
MSALPQFRHRENAAIPIDGQELANVPAPGRDTTVQLLQDAIARLKSSDGVLPDPAQVASLLAEAREALERANVIGRAAAEADAFVKEGQFDKAFETLDAALLQYPADPALVTRRRAVEEQQQAFHSAAAVRSALEQAEWLLHQNRTDLAAHFLEERVADLPDQPELVARLEELEALLPHWEQKRHVQATLGRVATLLQLEQSQAALTTLDEALQTYPGDEQLLAEVKRIREQLVDQEREKKLARRLELIGQKIAAQSWKQALTLLETTREEFPGRSELNSLWCDVDAGLRRSECEAIVAEMRQCLADGELEVAEEVLLRGLESYKNEPALEALCEELESARRYRDDLRRAQILFGRRHLLEAERILSRMATEDRPEAKALLDAVTAARTAAEEENFCERGREKARELIQQQQYAQATDLLRNLLALFPGNTILERDMMAAQNGLARESSQPAPEVAPAALESQALAAEPEAVLPVAAPKTPEKKAPIAESAPSGFRRKAIVGGLSVVLVSGAGLVWMLSRNGAPVQKQTAAQSDTKSPVTAAPAATAPAVTTPGNPTPAVESAHQQLPPITPPQPVSSAAPAAGKPQSQSKPQPREPLRAFVAPNAKQTSGQTQNSTLPLPPGTEPTISAQTFSISSAGIGKPLDGPAPPPTPQPQPAPAAATPVAQPAPPAGGKATEAVLIDRIMPAYPPVAKAHGIFGIVRLEASVDEHGAVRAVKILSGDRMLAEAARAAILRWRYKPATLNGKPIASSSIVQMNFGDQKK